MVPEQSPPNKLNTWQEIATYLGVSVRTAQTYEKDQGLPVLHTSGVRGRVVAYRSELDRWNRDRLRARPIADRLDMPPASLNGEQGPEEERASPVIADEQNTPPASNGSILIEIPTPPEEEVIASERAKSGPFGKRTSLKLITILIGFAVIVSLGLVVYWVWPIKQPVDYLVRVGTLITLDGEGKEVWRYQFPKAMVAQAYLGDKGHTGRCTFADLEGDGEIETLFVYAPIDYESAGYTLVCFARDGKVKWQFSPGRAVVRDKSGSEYFPPYYMSQVIAITQPRKKARVVVSSNHHMDSADQIAILDSKGQMTGEYWHSGHLLHLAHADLEGDGRQELLVAGVNNGDHAATLLVFDPENVRGASLGMMDSRFELKGFGPGSEKARVLFLKTCIDQEPFNRIGKLMVAGKRIYAVVNESVSEDNPKAIFYELDFGLKVVSASASAEAQAAYRQLQESGICPQGTLDFKDRVVVIRQ